MITLYKHMNIDEFLSWAQVVLDNARNVPEIAEAVARYGYDEPRMQEGVDMLAENRQLQADQVREYGEQYLATEALHAAWRQADKTYSTHRELVRLAFRSSPNMQAKLGLGEAKKRSLSGWLGQATVFYTNLLSDANALAELARYNLTLEALQAGQAEVGQVAQLNAAQEKEKYEAQQATKDRDAALDALNDWLVEFCGVAKIALADQPQQLEALQIAVVP